MNREILFRGKRKYTSEWVQGQHISWCNIHYVVPEDLIGHKDEYVVIPETVGEFTGLPDKNGVKIFEGDIVDLMGNCRRAEIIDMFDNPIKM